MPEEDDETDEGTLKQGNGEDGEPFGERLAERKDVK